VAKYSADIEIAVRGGQQINNTIRDLNRLNNSINLVTKRAKLLEGRGFNVASIENYSRAVAKAERAVNKAAAGTDLERRAITQLVTAMELENKARSRRNFLIAQEVASRRQVIATANAGVGVQGPALPRYMMTGPSSPIGGGLRGRGGGGGAAGGIRSRLGGAVSGGIIGLAFPLLFGQGAGAAAGGAIGGLLGGLAGPGGSFAGSLLGTLLGGIASKGQGIKDLAEDMGLAAEQTKELSAAFQLAGADADKFGAAVQTIRGIGFAEGTEIEAIKLVSRLTEEYGGKIDKVAAAYGNFVAKGKVGVADINKFTAQGVPILDELEKRYGKNRDQILGMAKDGKITAQDLSDALRDIANRSDQVTKKTTSSWEQTWINIQTGASTSARAFAIIFGRLVGVASSITGNIAQFFSKLYVDIVNGAVNAAANIANALANAANNIAAFYKTNPLLIAPLRDAAVKGLEAFKAGARGTAKDLQNLVKAQNAITGAVGPITVPGQEPPPSGADRSSAADEAEKARRAAEELANLQGQVTLKEKLFTIDKQIAIEKQRGNLVTAAALEMDKALEERANKIAEITRSTADQATKNAQIKDATLDADQKLFAVQQAIKEQEAERTKSYEQIIADLELELKLKTATTEQERERLRLEAERAKLEGFTDEQIGIITGLQAQVAAPLTDAQKIEQHIGKLKDEVAELTNIGNIAITVADGIGTAFGQAFQGLISGSMTAKEALGSFFKSVGDMFVEMAAEIIAKQMTMIILQTILKALGGGSFSPLSNAQATSFNFDPGAMTGSLTPGGLFAKGGTFSQNGIVPYASGGIVSSPTLFKFADGGATRTGLMGEAGPEAIMPLKRGSDGSLGVQATGLREAMGRPPGGANSSPVLNMSFQSTTINGVEYVSRDQLEAAMAATRRQAAKEGANRGMNMALDKIQNSPSTRSRVGIR